MSALNKNQNQSDATGTASEANQIMDTFMPEFTVAMNQDTKLLVARVRHANPGKIALAQLWARRLAERIRKPLLQRIPDAELRILIMLFVMDSLSLASAHQDSPCLEAGVTLARDGSVNVDESVDYLREEINANLPRSFFDEQIGASNAGF